VTQRTGSLAAIAAFLGATLWSVACGHAQVTLKLGVGLTPPHVSPLIFNDPALTRHNGKSYKVEMNSFRGSAAQLAALASGDIDIAALAYSTFAGGIVNGKQPIVAISDLCRDGPWFSNVFAVLDNSPVKSIADLKGKVIAINARGGSVDMAVRHMLNRNGLKPDSDVTIVEMGFGAMEAVLREGRATLSVFDPALWARVQQKGGVRPLFHQRDAQGTEQFLLYAVKAEFAKKNRAVLVDWLEDYVRGVNWLFDPANRDAAVQKAATLTKQDPALLKLWAFQEGKDWYHDPKGRLDVKAFQANVDMLTQFNILPRALNVADHIDESLVEEATGRLGRN
jgi:sulfonate transport system substrate-binding protein